MPVKNTLVDVHNILMESLERLNDDDLFEDPEKAKIEISRAKAISDVGRTIVDNAAVMLNAKKHADEFGRYGKKDATEADRVLLIEDNGSK